MEDLEFEIGQELNPEDLGEEGPVADSEFPASPYKAPLDCLYGGLTGGAGTGKSTAVQTAVKAAPNGWRIRKAATTGIAAVNMGEGVGTIHSLLGFYDTRSLESAYRRGKLYGMMAKLYKDGGRMIVVDEMSMMPKMQMSLIGMGLDKFNRTRKEDPLRLLMVGDFCQLPPVPDMDRFTGSPGPVEFAFESDWWKGHIAEHIHRLTKIHRQADPTFIAAMNAARHGNGEEAVSALLASGVEFGDEDAQFTGTTIVGTNREADDINLVKLHALIGNAFTIPAYHWWHGDRDPAEWKIIPKNEDLKLKKGARVMITTNIRNSMGQLIAANGDIGEVIGLQIGEETYGPSERLVTHPWVALGVGPKAVQGKAVVVQVRLTGVGRGDRVIDVYPIIRDYIDNPTKEWIEAQGGEDAAKELPAEWGRPWWDPEEKHWICGQIVYMPVRLAWALTCHKTQGLTLSNVQIQPQHRFFGSPAMVYVALSRCREPQGMRIAASPQTLAKRIKIEERVRPWL